LHKTYLAIL